MTDMRMARAELLEKGFDDLLREMVVFLAHRIVDLDVEGICGAEHGERSHALGDERVNVFRERPLEGDWPYLWIDATYVKVRQAGSIVSVAVIIALRRMNLP